MINAYTIIRIIWSKIRYLLTKKYDYSPLYNVYYYTWNKHPKRALLSYRVLQLRMWSKTTWSAGQDVRDIIRSLSELGYVTDVVYSRDTTFIPDRHYDLFIGHEGYNFESIVKKLPEHTTKVLFTSTAHWKSINTAEDKRIEEIYNKTGNRLVGVRQIQADEDRAFSLSTGVIMSGNEMCRKTYPPSDKIFLIETVSLDARKRLNVGQKNVLTGCTNFLFLGGAGAAHKGLDMLLNVFSEIPGKHLYICSVIEKDFADLYEKKLFHTENIHYMGYVKPYGKDFYGVMKKCNYLIFPSCSEGSPGSVVDCMVQGLIPIVSRASHIDVDGLGYYVDPCTEDEIIRLVKEVSSHEESWYRSKIAIVQKEANKRFSQTLFREKFKKYLCDIISSNLNRTYGTRF